MTVVEYRWNLQAWNGYSVVKNEASMVPPQVCHSGCFAEPVWLVGGLGRCLSRSVMSETVVDLPHFRRTGKRKGGAGPSEQLYPSDT